VKAYNTVCNTGSSFDSVEHEKRNEKKRAILLGNEAVTNSGGVPVLLWMDGCQALTMGRHQRTLVIGILEW